MHTKVSLNVRHRVVSPDRIAERTASPEIRLKLWCFRHQVLLRRV